MVEFALLEFALSLSALIYPVVNCNVSSLQCNINAFA